MNTIVILSQFNGKFEDRSKIAKYSFLNLLDRYNDGTNEENLVHDMAPAGIVFQFLNDAF